jgi:hypothetical protein
MKNYLLFIAFIASFQIFSQEAYMYSGNNLTKYKYKIGTEKLSSNLQSGSGNFYEVGLINPIIGKRIFYSLGFSINEYNAVGATLTSTYHWNTRFIGADSGFLISLFPHKPVRTNTVGKDKTAKDKSVNNQSDNKVYKALSLKRFDVLFNVGAKVATIVYGKQEIDGVFFDLMKEKEFAGVFIGSNVGLKLKYYIAPYASTSVGYNFCQSFNFSNKTEEKLSFNTNQVQFGLHLNIN